MLHHNLPQKLAQHDHTIYNYVDCLFHDFSDPLPVTQNVACVCIPQVQIRSPWGSPVKH